MWFTSRQLSLHTHHCYIIYSSSSLASSIPTPLSSSSSHSAVLLWMLQLIFPAQLWMAGVHYWLRCGQLKQCAYLLPYSMYIRLITYKNLPTSCMYSQIRIYLHNLQYLELYSSYSKPTHCCCQWRCLQKKIRTAILPSCKSIPELQLQRIASDGIATPQFLSRKIP